jgi:hypothetical protein
MKQRPSIVRKIVVAGAVVAGASLGAAGIASAATSSSANNSSGSPNAYAPPAGAVNPATLNHGPGETLLTGTNFQRAIAAAKAAVPGATVIRAETDSSGIAPYEVHMKKTDGSYVTVELNSSFHVTETSSGFGPGPAGHPAPNGMAPTPNPT